MRKAHIGKKYIFGIDKLFELMYYTYNNTLNPKVTMHCS